MRGSAHLPVLSWGILYKFWDYVFLYAVRCVLVFLSIFCSFLRFQFISLKEYVTIDTVKLQTYLEHFPQHVLFLLTWLLVGSLVLPSFQDIPTLRLDAIESLFYYQILSTPCVLISLFKDCISTNVLISRMVISPLLLI